MGKGGPKKQTTLFQVLMVTGGKNVQIADRRSDLKGEKFFFVKVK